MVAELGCGRCGCGRGEVFMTVGEGKREGGGMEREKQWWSV